MIELGKRQVLKVVKKVDFGVYLGEEMTAREHERVLLPGRQVPEGTEPGDTLEVFIYRDSSDRLIATTRVPIIQLHETALLTVADVGKIGAFLDWGLEKDLLLPFKEQTAHVKKGQEVLAALYIDKSSRLCATMKVYPYLQQNSPYIVGDEVKGRVYELSDNFGVFVAVDDKYSGLIPKKEAQGVYQPGEIISCRVTSVREDGKLNLSPRKKAYQQMEEDAALVLKVLDEFAGVLPFDDRVSPEIIKREFGLSKAAFKRAVGHLMKEKKIEIREKRIFRL
ncbi:MAG: S1-like domain-containing RNA-binding protein [Oliverpabstia sp.]|nr:S1-like domain-containing RNA-binding protein [Lachnospiraceae bacterium]MDY5027668.1 S1-like domain-containing RNA-binding protein [Oliverpabstia sp.]